MLVSDLGRATMRSRMSDLSEMMRRHAEKLRGITWKPPALLLTCLICLAAPANAQVTLASADQQFDYFAKLLTFDRNLKDRAGNSIVVGILYQEDDAQSHAAMKGIVRAIERSPLQRIRGLTISHAPIRIAGAVPSAGDLARHEIDVLYVTPTRGLDITKVADLCREQGITSWTPVREYVEAGIAVGVLTDGTKPLVVVNLPAARAEGANFSAQLLKLARVIQ